MQRFVIERDIPNIGAADAIFLKNAAKKSNEVLRQLGADIQWVESYIAGDKIFCIYLATNEEPIRKHSEMSGFPPRKFTGSTGKSIPRWQALQSLGRSRLDTRPETGG